jgi:hypothetical protein
VIEKGDCLATNELGKVVNDVIDVNVNLFRVARFFDRWREASSAYCKGCSGHATHSSQRSGYGTLKRYLHVCTLLYTHGF